MVPSHQHATPFPFISVPTHFPRCLQMPLPLGEPPSPSQGLHQLWYCAVSAGCVPGSGQSSRIVYLFSPQPCKAGEMMSHFTDEKTEALRGPMSCAMPHSYKVSEPQIREKGLV